MLSPKGERLRLRRNWFGKYVLQVEYIDVNGFRRWGNAEFSDIPHDFYERLEI